MYTVFIHDENHKTHTIKASSLDEAREITSEEKIEAYHRMGEKDYYDSDFYVVIEDEDGDPIE